MKVNLSLYFKSDGSESEQIVWVVSKVKRLTTPIVIVIVNNRVVSKLLLSLISMSISVSVSIYI